MHKLNSREFVGWNRYSPNKRQDQNTQHIYDLLILASHIYKFARGAHTIRNYFQINLLHAEAS